MHGKLRRHIRVDAGDELVRDRRRAVGSDAIDGGGRIPGIEPAESLQPLTGQNLAELCDPIAILVDRVVDRGRVLNGETKAACVAGSCDANIA